MERHLEAIGLAIAHADLELIPLTIRWAYHSGIRPEQVRAAIEVAAFLAEVPTPVRACAQAAAHAWEWVARRRAVA